MQDGRYAAKTSYERFFSLHLSCRSQSQTGQNPYCFPLQSSTQVLNLFCCCCFSHLVHPLRILTFGCPRFIPKSNFPPSVWFRISVLPPFLMTQEVQVLSPKVSVSVHFHACVSSNDFCTSRFSLLTYSSTLTETEVLMMSSCLL